MPKDFRVSITDAKGRASYPISSFTYLLVFQSGAGEKTAALKEMLAWALKEGQKFAPALNYSPLPNAMVPGVLASVKSIGTK
jgi:phosphate transport system substrate-binding protein